MIIYSIYIALDSTWFCFTIRKVVLVTVSYTVVTAHYSYLYYNNALDNVYLFIGGARRESRHETVRKSAWNASFVGMKRVVCRWETRCFSGTDFYALYSIDIQAIMRCMHFYAFFEKILKVSHRKHRNHRYRWHMMNGDSARSPRVLSGSARIMGRFSDRFSQPQPEP